MANLQLEFWLRGPVEGVPPLLQPVAHALFQARAEVSAALKYFPSELIWEKPGGAASVGFHLQHLTGVLDRLFTYARNEQLDDKQAHYLQQEGIKNEHVNVQQLLELFDQQVSKATEELKTMQEKNLLDSRGVGRKKIPSNVLGLLFHSAEHTQRHVGQLLVTAKILSAAGG